MLTTAFAYLPQNSIAQTASTQLEPRSGSSVSGTVKLMQTNDGIQFDAQVEGLKPGSAHGFHVHQGTDCDTADASSAGPHFNPKDMPHGGPNSSHSHAGDLPNLVATQDGRATLITISQQVSLASGAANNVLGRTIVVHADPDDHMTQPAGNAGSRIACGVIRAN
ncbi:superoxide dismutase family protein [Orrella daihaiensis]|uniref:Superoxide dismutase [Cu-Zn] n=2 Tax=Orrella daihaiensis TaxID=2782176 RepID=A0ABY4AMY1_9BURK|nr:superoxide dismutase family protein [Orrella daihaiensis]